MTPRPPSPPEDPAPAAPAATEQPAATQQAVPPLTTPAAGGRYRRNADGTLTLIPDPQE